MGMPSNGILTLGLHLSKGMGNELKKKRRGKGVERGEKKKKEEESEEWGRQEKQGLGRKNRMEGGDTKGEEVWW